MAAVRRHGLIDGTLRAPQPGAPFAYVTTKKFLEVFGLATLRDLPGIERLEDEGLLEMPKPEADLDAILFAGEDDFDAGEHWEWLTTELSRLDVRSSEGRCRKRRCRRPEAASEPSRAYCSISTG
ncbi:MAG: hypothetical protein FJX15_13320 [Alphaproteobacteria bacterium]|nr:hypothetical protein [Alphaproteobacteria bacterium]